MNLTIITGSTLGSAEYLAEDCATFLESEGVNVALFHGPSWKDIEPTLNDTNNWLVISSTHGAGEVPDNLTPFLETLQKETVDLTKIRFAIIGLGDRQYDTFCGALDHIKRILTHCGATEMNTALKLDMPNCDDPEQTAIDWLTQTILP